MDIVYFRRGWSVAQNIMFWVRGRCRFHSLLETWLALQTVRDVAPCPLLLARVEIKWFDEISHCCNAGLNVISPEEICEHTLILGGESSGIWRPWAKGSQCSPPFSIRFLRQCVSVWWGILDLAIFVGLRHATIPAWWDHQRYHRPLGGYKYGVAVQSPSWKQELSRKWLGFTIGKRPLFWLGLERNEINSEEILRTTADDYLSYWSLVADYIVSQKRMHRFRVKQVSDSTNLSLWNEELDSFWASNLPSILLRKNTFWHQSHSLEQGSETFSNIYGFSWCSPNGHPAGPIFHSFVRFSTFKMEYSICR
jgi:hypothetical protein